MLTQTAMPHSHPHHHEGPDPIAYEMLSHDVYDLPMEGEDGMSCLDSATLWALEAGELEGDDLHAARTHARGCLVCETSRRELQQTRRMLELAAGSAPSMKSWRAVDDAVDDAVVIVVRESAAEGQ